MVQTIDIINIAFAIAVGAGVLFVSRVFTTGMLGRFFLFVKIAMPFYISNLVLESLISNLSPNLIDLEDLLNSGFLIFVLAAFLSLYRVWKKTNMNYPVHPPQSAQNPSGNQ
ncbi:MAG: hypothetical protein ACYCPW_03155 [Nitrososphaerales archaeon]